MQLTRSCPRKPLQPLRLSSEKPVSNVPFNFNLYRYNKEGQYEEAKVWYGKGLAMCDASKEPEFTVGLALFTTRVYSGWVDWLRVCVARLSQTTQSSSHNTQRSSQTTQSSSQTTQSSSHTDQNSNQTTQRTPSPPASHGVSSARVVDASVWFVKPISDSREWRRVDASRYVTNLTPPGSGRQPYFAATLLTNRAECNRQMGEIKAVVGDCTTALQHAPRSLKAFLRRGLAYEFLEKYDDAAADFKSAMALDPGGAVASEGLRRVSAFKGVAA
jgi:tetratricopeptide (TPR) repeat protein